MSLADYSLTNYAIGTMIEGHEIDVARDTTAEDAFGAEDHTGFQPLATYTGTFWWWPVKGEGGFDEAGNPQRTVNVYGGGAILRPGQDIKEGDRVTEVRENGQVISEGPYRVTSVREHRGHMELSLEKP